MSENALKEFQKIVNDIALYFKHQRTLGMEVFASEDAQELLNVLDDLEKNLSPKKKTFACTPRTLETVREELGECTRCSLCLSRKNIVFGKGNPSASLVFVGEAPGGDEDAAGEPFVGEAGQLLTRIIQSINLRREDVYIGNVIKCRPPKNRDPKPEEIEACFPFLKKQLEVIRPRFICALGKFAAQTLLGTTERISQLRGKIFEFQHIKVVPTFHPASLLRNPEWKRAVWQDMQLIQRLLEENK
ncbi:MAG TPA: uracil-DNA glycosylase [Thermodesulfobacteriota bacterium]|nr:uracil-DNA glycosylase [Thermodesulfobacteriota bacterium]